MGSETHTAPEASAPAQASATATTAGKGKRQRRQRKPRDGWSLLEKLFGLLTALLTLMTAAIGLWGLNAASERDDLKEETSTLESDTADLEAERDQLAADLDEANGRIEELESDLDDGAAITPSDEDETGTTPRTPGDRGQLLTELDAVTSGGWEIRSGIYVDDGFHDQALVSNTLGHCSYPSDSTTEYSLRSQYETLTMTVGQTERSTAGKPVRVDIFGDDNELWTGTVQVAQNQDINVDVSGVIRLKVVVTVVFDYVQGNCSDVAAAALGDPTLN